MFLIKIHKPNLVIRQIASQIQLKYIVQNNWSRHFRKPILYAKISRIAILDEKKLKSHEKSNVVSDPRMDLQLKEKLLI